MRRSGSVLLFAAISLALHLAWVLVVPEGHRQIQPATRWVEVSFETVPATSLRAATATSSPEQPTAPEPAIEPQPEAARKPNKEQLAKTAKPRPEAEAKELVPQPEAAAPSAPEPSQLQAAASAPVEPAAPKQLAILPRTAALSLDALGSGSALRCGNRTSEGQSECAATEGQTGHAAQAALNRDLNDVAHSLAHLKAREHPKLKRRSDGSYLYDGHVFQAIVRPDGNVEFRDSAIRGELQISPAPFLYIADLNDVAERHLLGRELYSTEKQWLLNETRALRDQLASEFRRRELQGANRELERTLRSVLDDRRLTVEKKHETIFLLWQDCGEDAQEHRGAVERFVRRYMPKGSETGFGAKEIEHFNEGRRGLKRFEPYAGS